MWRLEEARPTATDCEILFCSCVHGSRWQVPGGEGARRRRLWHGDCGRGGKSAAARVQRGHRRTVNRMRWFVGLISQAHEAPQAQAGSIPAVRVGECTTIYVDGWGVTCVGDLHRVPRTRSEVRSGTLWRSPSSSVAVTDDGRREREAGRRQDSAGQSAVSSQQSVAQRERWC